MFLESYFVYMFIRICGTIFWEEDMELSSLVIFIVAIIGFCVLIGFEIRIVTYLKQMKNLLQEVVKNGQK